MLTFWPMLFFGDLSRWRGRQQGLSKDSDDVQLHEIIDISSTDLVITAKTDEGMSKLLLKRVD